MSDNSGHLQNKPNYSLSNLQETSLLLSRGLQDINKIKQANEHFLKGKNAYDNSDYETAVIEYGKAIELEPNNSVYYFERGNSYSVSLQDKNAFSDYAKALSLDPMNIEYYKCVADAYVGYDIDKAIEHCSIAIEIDKTDTDLYYDRATYYEIKAYNLSREKDKAKNLERAFNDYQTIIRINPNEVFGYSGRGGIYYKNKKYKEALADFINVLRISPHCNAYEQCGDCYYYLGEFEKSLIYYKTAIQYNKDKIINNISNKAIRNKIKVVSLILLKINPNNTECCKIIAEAYVEEDHFEKAIEYFTKAIEIDKTDADLYFDRAICYDILAHQKGMTAERTKNIEKEFNDYEMIVKINPNGASGYFAQGEIYFKNNKIKEAFESFNNGIRIDPNYYRAYELRGSCYCRFKEFEKGLNDFKLAIQDNINEKYLSKRLKEYAGRYLDRYIQRVYDIINSNDNKQGGCQ
jgi:tetratricopeptide (TPR) repeat protein